MRCGRRETRRPGAAKLRSKPSTSPLPPLGGGRVVSSLLSMPVNVSCADSSASLDRLRVGYLTRGKVTMRDWAFSSSRKGALVSYRSVGA